jgi:hypothetical protein
VEELRIGSFNDPETAFSDIEAISVSSTGTVFVAQARDNEIAVFDRFGTRLRTIGREGEGPGEFRGIRSLGVKQDTLWVSDSRNNRVTFFAPDGRILEDFPFAPGVAMGNGTYLRPSAPSAMFDDGSLLSLASTSAGSIARGQVTHLPVLHFSREVHVLDTIGWRDSRRSSISFLSKDSETHIRNPLSDHTLFDALPDGSGIFLVERSHESEVEEATVLISKVTPTGDTLSRWRVPYHPEPLSGDLGEKLIRQELSPVLNYLKELGQSPESLSEHLPQFFPAVTEVAAMEGGGVWLRREIELGDSIWWQLLSPDGETVSRVRAHRSLKIFVSYPEHVWGSELGLGDIPYLVRYRIEKRSG